MKRDPLERLRNATASSFRVALATQLLSLLIQGTHLTHHHAHASRPALTHILHTQQSHLHAATALFYLTLPLFLALPRARPTAVAALLHVAQIADAVAFPMLGQPLTAVTLGEDAPVGANLTLLRVIAEAWVLTAAAHPLPLLLHLAAAVAIFRFRFPGTLKPAAPNGRRLLPLALLLLLPAAAPLVYTAMLSRATYIPSTTLSQIRTQDSLFAPATALLTNPSAAPFRRLAALMRTLLRDLRAPAAAFHPGRRDSAGARRHFLRSRRRHNAITDHPARLRLDAAARADPTGYSAFFDAVWRRAPARARAASIAAGARVEDAAALLTAQAVDAGVKRNIVLIIMESTGAISSMRPSEPPDGLSMTLDPLVTPALHRLFHSSAPGLLFDRAYTSYPASAKSVGSVLSGHAPTWGSAARKYLSRHDGPSALPAALRKRGFRTGFFSASLDLDWDWTRWLLEDSLAFDKVSNCNTSIASSRKLNSWACEEEVAWDALLRFARQSDHDRIPFLAVIFTTAPHFPYSVSTRFRASALNARTDFGRPIENRRQLDYLRALSYTDDNFGRTLDAMNDETALADRTLFAVIGDHGEAFGGRHKSNMLHRNHLYEENIRVSLLLAQPCFRAPWKAMTAVDHRPVSNIDIAVTLIGASAPPDKGAVHSEPPVADSLEWQPGRNLLLRKASDTGNMVYFVKRANSGRAGLVDGDWKFTMLIEPPEEHLRRPGRQLRVEDFDELFDLSMDPLEQNNLLRHGNISDPVHLRQWKKYAALVEMWFGMADCVYQEQFSSLTMHPFCRTVHLYRGDQGRLQSVKSLQIERVGSVQVLTVVFEEETVLPRKGAVQIAVLREDDIADDGVCGKPDLAAVFGFSMMWDKTCVLGQELVSIVVPAEVTKIVVPLSETVSILQGRKRIRIYSTHGADVTLLLEDDKFL